MKTSGRVIARTAERGWSPMINEQIAADNHALIDRNRELMEAMR